MQKFKTLLSLFLTYLKIGLFTFGGGYAMIALIEENVVNKKKWITKDELTDIVTIAESTPGPIAINCSTYVGYKICGVLGSAVATIACVIPSFVIIFGISLVFDWFMSMTYVQYAFNGIKCAVGLIILRQGIKMLKSFKKNVFSLICFFIALVGILLINFFAVDFSTVFFILAGAVLGVFIYILEVVKKNRQEKFATKTEASLQSDTENVEEVEGGNEQ
ncbi:MAG: chromate transporter [Clostridiales bacterium]|nr:chromate transporter [Clostridiales bacterium]